MNRDGVTSGCTAGGKYLSFLMLLTLIIHPISFVLDIGSSLGIYLTFVCYLLLLGYALMNRAWFLRRYELVLVCIATVSCALGALSGISNFGAAGFGSAVGYLLGTTSILAFSSRLTKRDILLILKVVAVFGMIAALYAFIFQSNLWMNVLAGNHVGSSGWQYYSFFGQRNRFAACMYLSAVGCGALYCLTRKKIYCVAALFLLIQIIFTNSRTSLIAALVAIAVLIYKTSKNRVFTCAVVVLIAFLAITLFSDDLFSQFSAYLTHYDGYDSASIRTDMWEYGLGLVLQDTHWLFGFGTGTQEDVLMPLFGVASFHNMYVEVLFEGGIVKLGLYVVIIIYSIYLAKSNENFCNDGIFSFFYLPFLSSWSVFSLFESSATPFSTTFFSFVTGILLVLIPRCYGNQKKDDCYKAWNSRKFNVVGCDQSQKLLVYESDGCYSKRNFSALCDSNYEMNVGITSLSEFLRLSQKDAGEKRDNKPSKDATRGGAYA